MQISLDGTPVETWDPFCLKEERTELFGSENIEVVIYDNKSTSFTVNAYVIPRPEEFSNTEEKKKGKDFKWYAGNLYLP